jgi:hypothetical protein
VFGLHTYDHVTCMHFHYPLHMTFSSCLQLVVNYDSIDTTSVPLGCHYISMIFPLFNDYCSFLLLLIFYYIVIHNIMLPYGPFKPYNSLKVKDLFSNDIKNNVYTILQIHLRCTHASTFIYFDVLYPKCLIDSLAKVNSFKPIVGLCLLIIIKKFKMNHKG